MKPEIRWESWPSWGCKLERKSCIYQYYGVNSFSDEIILV